MSSDFTNYRVFVVLFPGVEIFDFFGPYDAFSVSNTATQNSCHMVTLGYDPTLSSPSSPTPPIAIGRIGGRMAVQADFDLRLIDDAHTINGTLPRLPYILVVPGGRDGRPLLKDPAFLSKIESLHSGSTFTLTVCTGSLFLAACRCLDDFPSVITHHLALGEMKALVPPSVRVEFRPSVRYLKYGKTYMSGGISAGMDASLKMIGDLFGEDVEIKTMKLLEYPYGADDSASKRNKMYDLMIEDVKKQGVDVKVDS